MFKAILISLLRRDDVLRNDDFLLQEDDDMIHISYIINPEPQHKCRIAVYIRTLEIYMTGFKQKIEGKSVYYIDANQTFYLTKNTTKILEALYESDIIINTDYKDPRYSNYLKSDVYYIEYDQLKDYMACTYSKSIYETLILHIPSKKLDNFIASLDACDDDNPLITASERHFLSNIASMCNQSDQPHFTTKIKTKCLVLFIDLRFRDFQTVLTSLIHKLFANHLRRMDKDITIRINLRVVDNVPQDISVFQNLLNFFDIFKPPVKQVKVYDAYDKILYDSNDIKYTYIDVIYKLKHTKINTVNFESLNVNKLHDIY